MAKIDLLKPFKDMAKADRAAGIKVEGELSVDPELLAQVTIETVGPAVAEVVRENLDQGRGPDGTPLAAPHPNTIKRRGPGPRGTARTGELRAGIQARKSQKGVTVDVSRGRFPAAWYVWQDNKFELAMDHPTVQAALADADQKIAAIVEGKDKKK